MTDDRSFTETIVAMLGTPGEPFGLEALLALALLAIAGAAWIAFELGVAALVARLLRRLGPDKPGDEAP
jgi:hypothetical protein